MASMTLSALLTELERLRANGLPPSRIVVEAASQLTADQTAALAAQITADAATLAALQATYDAYVAAHP